VPPADPPIRPPSLAPFEAPSETPQATPALVAIAPQLSPTAQSEELVVSLLGFYVSFFSLYYSSYCPGEDGAIVAQIAHLQRRCDLWHPQKLATTRTRPFWLRSSPKQEPATRKTDPMMRQLMMAMETLLEKQNNGTPERPFLLTALARADRWCSSAFKWFKQLFYLYM
jgi:hypothetical protein